MSEPKPVDLKNLREVIGALAHLPGTHMILSYATDELERLRGLDDAIHEVDSARKLVEAFRQANDALRAENTTLREHGDEAFQEAQRFLKENTALRADAAAHVRTQEWLDKFQGEVGALEIECMRLRARIEKMEAQPSEDEIREACSAAQAMPWNDAARMLTAFLARRKELAK